MDHQSSTVNGLRKHCSALIVADQGVCQKVPSGVPEATLSLVWEAGY